MKQSLFFQHFELFVNFFPKQFCNKWYSQFLKKEANKNVTLTLISPYLLWNWINKNVAFSATASSKVKLFSLLGCKMQFNGNRLKREKHSVKYSLSLLSSMANIQSWKLENSFAPWGKYSSTICMTLWIRWQNLSSKEYSK